MTIAHPYPRRHVAFLLGGCAGCLDAIGYLTFGIFVANMTGNTVLLGVFGGHAQWGPAGRALLIVAAFFAGAMLSAAVMQGRQRLAEILGAESILLLVAVAVWVVARPEPPAALSEAAARTMIALLGAAMGMQAAAVRRVGQFRLSTTFVTGTLVGLAVDAVDLLAQTGGTAGVGSPAGQRASILAAVWASYLCGALIGGAVQYGVGFGAVLLPTAVIAILAARDLG